MREANIRAIAIDVAHLADAHALDGLASVLDTGKAAVLGVIPAQAPSTPISSDVLATRTAALADKLGFGRAMLRDRVGVSAGCGGDTRTRHAGGLRRACRSATPEIRRQPSRRAAKHLRPHQD
ncbi:Putative methionine synthase, vitamin-B12 independent [Mycobacteroides abscessus subsp. abscessus]|nr:Putative methionine synthase, vitamin-B12 independent [Mycobacteroides abscessus subsp. abscessus]